MHRKHIHYQRFDRLRKPSNRFVKFFAQQAARLSIPARALRDLIRRLGTKEGYEVAAAANLAATGLTYSTAADVDFGVAGDPPLQADTDDAPFTLGPRMNTVADPAFLGQDAGTNLKLGAATGTITVDFVSGTPDKVVRATGSFLTDGFRAGCSFAVASAAQAGNAGPFTALSVTALELRVTAGALTADTGDSVAITSLDVVSGGAGVAALIANENGAKLTIAAGPNAGNYDFAAGQGADFVLLADPLVSVDADYDEGAFVYNTITRQSGNFFDEGFASPCIARVTGADNTDLNGDYSVTYANSNILIFSGGLAGTEASSDALVFVPYIERATGSFVDDGFEGGDEILVDDVSVGLVEDVQATRLFIDTPMTLDIAGTETSSVIVANSGTDDDLTKLSRASGSFVSDGFAAGHKVYLAVAGGDAADGVYTLQSVAALELTLTQSLPELATGVEAVLYRLSAASRA